jgi:hypothetical protein
VNPPDQVRVVERHSFPWLYCAWALAQWALVAHFYGWI